MSKAGSPITTRSMISKPADVSETSRADKPMPARHVVMDTSGLAELLLRIEDNRREDQKRMEQHQHRLEEERREDRRRSDEIFAGLIQQLSMKGNFVDPAAPGYVKTEPQDTSFRASMTKSTFHEKDLPSFDPEITTEEAEIICGKRVGNLSAEDKVVALAMKYLNFEQKFRHATRRCDEHEQVDALYRAVKGRADDRLWRTKLDAIEPMFAKMRSWYARNDGGCLEEALSDMLRSSAIRINESVVEYATRFMTLVERTQQFPGAELTDDQVRRVFVKSIVKRPSIHERLMFWPDLHKSSVESVIEKAISLSLTADRVSRDVQLAENRIFRNRQPREEHDPKLPQDTNLQRSSGSDADDKPGYSGRYAGNKPNAQPWRRNQVGQAGQAERGNWPRSSETNDRPGTSSGPVETRTGTNEVNQVHPDRRANVLSNENIAKARRIDTGSRDNECVTITLPGAISRPAKLDSGADILILSKDTIQDMEEAGAAAKISPSTLTSIVYGLDDHRVQVLGEIVLPDLWLTRLTGSVRMTNVRAYVIEQFVPEILISNNLLKGMSIDIDQAFDTFARWHPVIDLSESDERRSKAGIRRVKFISGDCDRVEGHQEYDDDDDLSRNQLMNIDEEDPAEKQAIFETKLTEMASHGYPSQAIQAIRQVWAEYESLFTIGMPIGQGMDVPPLIIELKEGANPTHAKRAKYNEQAKEFLHEQTRQLVDAGMWYLNPRARCSSRALVQAKPHGGSRLCVDLRRLNAITVPMSWVPLDFDCIGIRLSGSRVFMTLDANSGYFQLPVHEQSQELFSVSTHEGIYTSSRTLQGSVNGSMHWQSTMKIVYPEQDGFEINMDDILIHDMDIMAAIETLRRVLEGAKRRRLIFSLKKWKLPAPSQEFCGKIYSGDGITHSQDRISALTRMGRPTTYGQLMQFVCKAGWMRDCLAKFSEVMQPLQKLLNEGIKGTKRRCLSEANKIKLEQPEWTSEHDRAMDEAVDMLTQHVLLAHPRPEWVVHLIPDGNYSSWAYAITQTPTYDPAVPLKDHHHEMLALNSGNYTGAQLNWAIIGKEAYPIVVAHDKHGYLLSRIRGHMIHTDHRNLQYIFDPSAFGVVKRHTLDRLERWAIGLSSCRHETKHIPGADNLADLWTRWGAPRKEGSNRKSSGEESTTHARISRVHAETEVEVPGDEGERYPTIEEIMQQQRRYEQEKPKEAILQSGGLWTVRGCIWIPIGADQLRARILVIGHTGLAGHRGQQATHAAISKRFFWIKMKQDIDEFGRSCLVCLTSKGSMFEARPFGGAIHGDKPNSVHHMDYLFIRKASRQESRPMEYLLVQQDDLSHMIRLTPTSKACAAVAADALLKWASLFGVPSILVTDGGSHFANQTIGELTKLTRTDHHITTAYCPWANGTAENPNRLIVELFRILTTEFKIAEQGWPVLVPVIEYVLNHAPRPSLANIAPITVMTGMEAQSPLDFMFVKTAEDMPVFPRTRTSEELVSLIMKKAEILSVKQLRARNSLENRRQQSRAAASKGSRANFQVGDFVLLAVLNRRQVQSKISRRWTGPFRVVVVTSDWIYVIENIVTDERETAHASRLRFYHDGSLEKTAELIAFAAQSGIGYSIDSIVEFRVNNRTRKPEVLISWSGFEEEDRTWEPLDIIEEDAPILVKKFARDNPGSNIEKYFKSIKSGEGGMVRP